MSSFSDTPIGTYVSRRRLFALLPALGLPIFGSRLAAGQEEHEQFFFSPADSVLYYRLLLETVKSDALSALGHVAAVGWKNCSDLLADLKAKLGELRQRLQRAPHHASALNLDRYVAMLEHNVALMQQYDSDELDPLLAPSAPIANAALVEAFKSASENCELDPKGEIRDLLDKIFAELDEQNREFAIYSLSLDDYLRKNKKIYADIRECEEKIEEVGSLLGDVFGMNLGKYSVDLAEVRKSTKLLDDIVAKVNGLSVDSGRNAKDTLIGLLEATKRSLALTEAPALVLTSGGSFKVGAAAPVVLFDEGLYGRVKTVVNTPGYFRWGTFIQVLNCIAVCTPIWLSYPGAEKKDLRRRLIGEALQYLVWGVLKIEEVALALVDVNEPTQGRS